jgi:DNA-binding PadR family transcriptional regulator
MSKQKRSNPLALAVLVLLYERPMHPYEMAATLRERHKEESIKLRYGSLYTVIEMLEGSGTIFARQTSREATGLNAPPMKSPSPVKSRCATGCAKSSAAR